MAACNFRQRQCRDAALRSRVQARTELVYHYMFSREAAYGMCRSAVRAWGGPVGQLQRFPHDTGPLRRVPPARTCPFRPRTLAALPRRPVSRGFCAALFMPDPVPLQQRVPAAERLAYRRSSMALDA